MDKNDTIIVVGATSLDGYGNLFVTPQGGGDKIKIAAKRANLHPLFEQGRAVMCHWETYMDKPYVADAKAVEGELPPPVKPPISEAGRLPEGAVKIQLTKDESIAKLNGLNNASLLASNGLIPVDSIGLLAYQFERYAKGELDATQLDTNIRALLKTK